MKRTKSTRSVARWLLVSTLICGSAVVVTSCGENTLEEILGAVDNPAPKAATISFASASKAWGTLDGNFTLEVTNTGDGVVSYSLADPAIATINPTTGEVTPLTAGTTTITATVSNSDNSIYESHTAQYTLTVGTGYHYLKWNTATEIFDVEYATGTPLEGTVANTAITNGTYIIKGNVSITGDVSISANVELILLDGSNLDIAGKFNGGNTKSLTIYAQSEGSDMGQMNVECNNGGALVLKSLTIHGGKVTAKGSYTTTPGVGIKTYGNVYIYGGEVKAQGSDVTSIGDDGGCGMKLENSGTINIMNHAKVQVIGGKSSGANGGYGIVGYVVISGDAELKAIGGDCSRDAYRGGRGIDGTVTASSHAKVTTKGGDGTDNNVEGGMGTAGFTTVKDYAQLIATGGNGHGNNPGGNAVSRLDIHDNAYVEATGGNGGDGGTLGKGGSAISANLDYYGGKFIALAGEKGASAPGVMAMITLNNKTASPVTFQYTTDGTTWPNVFDVSGGGSNSSEAHYRGVRKLD